MDAEGDSQGLALGAGSGVFGNISVQLRPGGTEGIIIVAQIDYWDSINIKEGADPSVPQTQYQKVSKSAAIQDFLGQLKPDGFQAPAAAPEFPYLLLCRGERNELRRYPGFYDSKMPYEMRDYRFGSLGVFAKGMEPMAPR